jgi:SAM-dependent methyltransferase
VDIVAAREHWEELARTDPLRGILFVPNKTGAAPWDPAEFFATGVEEAARLRALLAARGVVVPARRALDFGCGVGRVTQALCAYFASVDGVDLAQAMLDHADRFNRFGPRCRYQRSESESLELFGDDTFDLVYSNHTLQHVGPWLAARYVRAFARVLAPGGVMVFQLPSPLWSPASATSGIDLGWRLAGIPRAHVLLMLQALGLRTIAADVDVTFAQRRERFVDVLYVAAKPAG